MLFNLKASKEGVVEFKIPDSQNYSTVTIVAYDGDSVTQTYHDLAPSDKIPTRDLSQRGGTDGVVESRDAVTLAKGDKCHIQDIVSSQIQIIDTLDKVHKVVQ